ncbi:MAG TPA: alpha-2-macroglobulin family protein [Pyrinomonadaceae bacterium]|nr:alpha-2-macroglobulin family protein [Pyrinomonadaceae bacterium]
MIANRITAALLTFFLISGCLPTITSPVLGAGAEAAESNQTEGTQNKKGLQFRLSEGLAQRKPETRASITTATVLSAAETDRLLSRLPAIKVTDSDDQPFALRDRSQPPPRTGKTINTPFSGSSATTAAESVSGALQVLRVAPQGNISIAPNLSVTFSQPMAPIGSLEDVAANVPLKLSPQPPGKWHWLGTNTLVFEPDGRFPMATDYAVTVPPGTRSTSGSTLKASKSWRFATPPAEVMKTFPGKDDTQTRDPMMFVEFNQRIDSEAVVKTIKIRAGNVIRSARLATTEEVRGNEEIQQLADKATADRWLAFLAVNPDPKQISAALPPGTRATVIIGPGVPSAEGPKLSTKAQTFSFPTYGALRVAGHDCDDSKRCQRNNAFDIKFTNDLDESSFKSSLVKVTPAIERMETSINGDTLSIDGVKRGGITYRVTLDQGIKDEFGQSLGRSQSVAFYVSHSQPVLSAPEKSFAVLNPFGPPTFSVYSNNYSSLKVRLYSVQPEDYSKWLLYQNPPEKGEQPERPGRLVMSRTIAVKAKPDEAIETPIDVSPALKDGHGQMIIVVESPEVRGGAIYRVETWLQRTDIGLDAFVDKTQLVGWATSLRTGSALANVELELLSAGIKKSTVVDGTARLALGSITSDSLVARLGNDVALLPKQTTSWDSSANWFRDPNIDSLRWFVFDDRKIYRPGEEVHIKGWIRRIGGDPFGDVGLARDANTTTNVLYTVKDSRGVDVARAGTQIGPLGGFDFTFKLPSTMNLGNARAELVTNSKLTDSSFTHQFQVQEFRRPEFEVEAQVDSAPPHFVGAAADLSVAAKYYSGGGLADALIRWKVDSEAGQFTPPNRGDFTFGKWIPWWGSTYDSTRSSQNHTETFSARTDADGNHRLHIDFDSVDPPRPTVLTAEASVTDVNRQTWSATTTLLVHPADLYVGLRSNKTFVQQGQPLIVESIVTDIEGKLVSEREIKMHAALLEWQHVSGNWVQVEKNPQECSALSNASTTTCNFQTAQSGQYRVLAAIHDQRGRANESELTLWVAGNTPASEYSYSLNEVKLVPDKKEYHAGDNAEILVQTHLYPAEGMVTLLRSGILKTEAFHIDGPTHTLRIPIEAAWTPNVTVRVNLNGTLNRGQDKEASYATGQLDLSIPPLDRKLQVTATARDRTLEPGAETQISVEVKNAAGAPVSGSEVTLLAVDESVLALTDYELVDPLTTFYASRSDDTTHYQLRDNVTGAHSKDEIERFISHYWRRSSYGYPEAPGVGRGLLAARSQMVSGVRNLSGFYLLAPGSVYSAAFGKIKSGDINVVTKSGTNEPDELPKIRLRENFDALAVFAPAVKTDANGHATVRVKLPDNLTRYRVMAYAVSGGKYFGCVESDLTAQMQLMVRPSVPRFLNMGDQFELPVVVQNQTNQALTAAVAVRAINARFVESLTEVELSAATAGWQPAVQVGRRVNVPANDRVEIRIPTVTVKPGMAVFRLSVASGQMSDAASASFPVWTPATTEAFATYGQLDDGAITQSIATPKNVFSEYGGLEIETSSTQLQQLTDAVLYLTNYPYECSEQLSSRIIGIAALRDVLSSFRARDMPGQAELEAIVVRDLTRLQGMQNSDGGFGFWKRGDESWPYLTIHVAHALARAKQKKFNVPAAMIENVSEYLKNVESHLPARYDLYDRYARRALIAYSLYVRAQLGKRDAAGARKLIATAGLQNLSLEAVGWILSVLAGDKASQTQIELIRRHLDNRVTETASTAHFVSDYSDGNYLLLNSERRTDAVILEALIADQKTNDLIPKIVRGLLEHRTRGRWENTQENAFVLLALDRYFHTYEKVTPNFIARVWLGDAYAGQQEFQGRATDRQDVKVPMNYLVNNPSARSLTLSKEGAGRLYYRIGMSYAPSDLDVKSIDSGFTVQREYVAIDDPGDVIRAADGSWQIKAGARVRVRLTMFAPAERYHVALTDPLPGGFETLNPALVVSQTVSEDNKSEMEMDRQLHWFDQQNLRDERTEAFTARLWPGVYGYSYVARATTPGNFVVPPVKVEEMYHPETFARGKSDRVRIKQ